MLHLSRTGFIDAPTTQRRIDEIDRLRSLLPADDLDAQSECDADAQDCREHLTFLDWLGEQDAEDFALDAEYL